MSDEKKNEVVEEVKVEEKPGHGAAVGALVLGIISAASCFTGIGALVGLVLGIIGIVKANKAKKLGNTEGIRTAGFVCSIVGTVAAGIAVVLVLFVGGLVGAAAIFA